MRAGLIAAFAVAAGLAGGGNEDRPQRTIPQLVSSSGIVDAQRYAASRPGIVAFAVMTENGRIRGYNVDLQFRSASVTKAMLMVAVLRRAATRPLTVDEQRLLTPMVVESDNDAADEVYEEIGDPALSAVALAARMTHFLPVGALYETRITAADQARLFLRIDRLVPGRHRAYARQLLASIVSPQRWGIAPVATSRHFAAFFKVGWRKGITHQAALLERDGRRVALAVLTAGEAPQAVGRATVAGIASRALAR